MSRDRADKNSILAYFKENPNQKFYLRELSRRLNLDAGNLSRALNSLAENNFLLKMKEGNLTYFSINPTNLDPDKTASLLKSNEFKNYLSKIEPDLVKFCQSLIRLPSVSGENPEEKIAQFIFNRSKELGLAPKIISKDRRRPNVVIDLDHKIDASKPNFLLVGHMDTIGIGKIDNWRYYPFSAHLSGGRVYGRGAIDMKAGIACQIFLLKMVKDLNINLPVNPRVILVSNEEGGSTSTPIFDLGMEHLVEEGLIDGIAAIYCYGGSYNIGIGHRGVLRIKITTAGEAIHTGSIKWQRKEKGANAVTAMAEILLSLESFELPKSKHPSFPKHDNVVTPGTMILHGGSAVSTVPDFCESVVDIRYLPGINIMKIYHKIKERVEKIAHKRGLKVELERFVNIPAVSLSPSEEIVQIVSSACESVYGNKITTRGTGPANESFMLIKKGIPTVVFGPLGARAHSDDEFVYIASLVKTLRVYLLTLFNSPSE